MKNGSGNLKAYLFDLAEKDIEALAFIRETLEINSNALAVRLAIRELARRLKEKQMQGKD